MKTSFFILPILAIVLAMLPVAQAQASDYNNLCVACTGRGYYYCPTTGVCYDPNVPISNVSIPTNSTKLNSPKILEEGSVGLEQVRLTQSTNITCNCTTTCVNATNGTKVCTTNCTGTNCTNKPSNCSGSWNGTFCNTTNTTNCTGTNCTKPANCTGSWNGTFCNTTNTTNCTGTNCTKPANCTGTWNGTFCNVTNCTGTNCTKPANCTGTWNGTFCNNTKPANCTGTWNGTFCISNSTNCTGNTTGGNCTQPTQWNVTYYTCPVSPFTPFNNPCRANFPCAAGVNGVLQLGMENDSFG